MKETVPSMLWRMPTRSRPPQQTRNLRLVCKFVYNFVMLFMNSAALCCVFLLIFLFLLQLHKRIVQKKENEINLPTLDEKEEYCFLVALYLIHISSILKIDLHLQRLGRIPLKI
jgi:uncharacterized protein with PQ loop repeat